NSDTDLVNVWVMCVDRQVWLLLVSSKLCVCVCVCASLQLARSPLCLKLSFSSLPAMPVFSHMVLISLMHSLGLKEKSSFPERMVRLWELPFHSFSKSWLSRAEKEDMRQ